MNRLWVYCDGSARPNNAFGSMGAGIVIISGKRAYGFGKYLGKGTNNQAELKAMDLAMDLALQGLKHVTDWQNTVEVLILSDSEYSICSVTGVWKLTSAKKNYQLIKQVTDKTKKFPHIKFQHVYGHAENEWNNWADELSVRGGKGEDVTEVRGTIAGPVLQEDAVGQGAKE